MTRIEAAFAAAKAAKRAAFIPFIMGYDGGREVTEKALDAIAANGADLIEIGVPFSDPMADGVVIQAAGLRALKAGASLKKILEIVTSFRKRNANTPIILMGYYNPIYAYGAEAFCKDAAAAGVDGIIVVDLPPEEEAELSPQLAKNKVDFIRLIAPTSKDARLKKLTQTASGFIYYIAVAGITGGKSATKEELASRLADIRTHSKLPIAVGFGIKTPSQAAELHGIADAVVVGSALVDAMAKSADPAKAAGEFIKQIAGGA